MKSLCLNNQNTEKVLNSFVNEIIFRQGKLQKTKKSLSASLLSWKMKCDANIFFVEIFLEMQMKIKSRKLLLN